MLVFILFIFLGVGGCGSFMNKQKNIFNNEDRLLESADSFTFSSKKGEISADQAVINFRGFSGVYTVWQMTSEYDISLNINVHGNISGKFKLIQTTEDRQLTTLWTGEKDDDITLKVPKGKSALKWVGQKSAGELTIQFDAQEGLVAEPQADLFKGGLFDDE